MLVSIAQNNYISRQSIKRRKVSGSPEEVREEGWAEGWPSGSRDYKRQGPDPHSSLKAPGHSQVPVGIRILRQWKDGEQLATPRASLALALASLALQLTCDFIQLQPRIEIPRMALRSPRLIPKAGRTHTFFRDQHCSCQTLLVAIKTQVFMMHRISSFK